MTDDALSALARETARKVCLYDEETHQRFRAVRAGCPTCRQNAAIIESALSQQAERIRELENENFRLRDERDVLAAAFRPVTPEGGTGE